MKRERKAGAWEGARAGTGQGEGSLRIEKVVAGAAGKRRRGESQLGTECRGHSWALRSSEQQAGMHDQREGR